MTTPSPERPEPPTKPGKCRLCGASIVAYFDFCGDCINAERAKIEATRTPAPDVAGEPSIEKLVNWFVHPTPPADKNAEPFGKIKGPGSGVIIPPFNYPLPPEIAAHIRDDKPTVHLITGPNGECICGTDEKTCAEVVARLMAVSPSADLTAARTRIAEQDGLIKELVGALKQISELPSCDEPQSSLDKATDIATEALAAAEAMKQP